jgi:cytochrome oxidase Cu insertion factor (SCO1/SenC/PrrC family)
MIARTEASDLDALIRSSDPAIPRTDSDGRLLRDEDVRDRLTVVSFASAGCAILCVARTMALDALARDLPASLRGCVVFLAVGTDPADDPVRLRAFARDLLGAAPRLRFLPSDAAGVTALATALRYPAARLPEPPPTVLLFDRRGRIAMTYGGDSLDAPRLQRDLIALDTFTEGLDVRSPAR